MKKIILNLILSILLSITIIVSLFALTILNTNFIFNRLEHSTYLASLNTEVRNALEDAYDEKQIEKDVRDFIKNKFANQLTYQINSNEHDNEVYNRYIKFDNYFANFNVRLWRLIIYGGDLLLIFITGSLFLKTQKKHNLKMIGLMSFGLLVIFYGISYLLDISPNYFINEIYVSYLHWVLAFAIILLEYAGYNIIKPKILQIQQKRGK